jgi:hypothetical protein
MTGFNLMGEPFAFWLVQAFLISEEDQTDEMQPLTNTYTFMMAIVILIVIVLVGLLLSR